MLSDEQKKMLTEFLGECWHESEEDDRRCIHCQKHLEGWRIKDLKNNDIFIVNSKIEYRTFTSWQDLGDLKENIVKMGEWESFLIYAASTFSPDREMKNFTNYLLDPTRFSELVARWWEERKVKEGEGMICPICGRLLKPVVIMWNECEELRWNSKHDYFCPCCGATVNIEDKDGSQCHTLKEGR